MNKQTRRIVSVMVLAVMVYGFFALYSGYEKIAERLTAFHWWGFAGACGLAFVGYLLRYLKWEYYLSRLDIRGVGKLDSLLIFLSGFVLTVTPGKVGEVFKSWILEQTHHIPVARTATIVVAERLTDLIGIVILIIIGSLGFTGGLLWAGIGAVAVIIALGVIMSRRAMDVSIRLLEKMPGRIGKLGPKVRESWDNLKILTTPGALLLPALVSVGAWAMEGIGLWLILKGFGESVAVAPAMFFYATSQAAGALTPLPGGLGVTEGTMQAQLTAVGGVTAPTATAAMMLARFATLWFAVVVGLTALTWLRTRFANVQMQAPPQEKQPSP